MKQQNKTTIKNKEKSKAKFRVYLIIATMILLNFAFVLIFFTERNKYKIYTSAKEMYDSGDYYNAILTWDKAQKFNDSEQRMKEAGCKLVEQLAAEVTEENFDQYIDKIRLAKKYAGLYGDENPDKLVKYYYAVLELDELDDGEMHDISDIYDYINDSPKKLFPEKIEQNSVLQMAKSLDGTWESVRDNKHSTPNVFLINNMHVELKFESADNPVIANYHIFYKQGALFIDYPGNTKTEDQHFDNELLDYTGGNDDSFFYYTYYVDDDKNIHDMSLIYNRVE